MLGYLQREGHIRIVTYPKEKLNKNSNLPIFEVYAILSSLSLGKVCIYVILKYRVSDQTTDNECDWSNLNTVL